MGTDRTPVFDKFLEGVGHVVIEYCEPDHGWDTKSFWYRLNITDIPENASATIFEFDDGFYLVEKKEIEEKEILESQRSELFTEISDYIKERKYYDLVAMYLNRHESASSAYYEIKDIVNFYGSLDTFRKSFKRHECYPAWVERNTTFESLSDYLKMIGKEDPSLDEKIREWNERETEFKNTPSKPTKPILTKRS